MDVSMTPKFINIGDIYKDEGLKMKEIGYFEDKNCEYVIENMFPLRPLKNYLWNEEMFAEINQFGFGVSKACIDNEFRPIVNEKRLVYIKDNITGKVFDANRNFNSLPYDNFNATVGFGYHIVRSEYLGVKTEFSIIIPNRDFVEMHKVKITNTSNENRNLSIYTYINPYVNLNGHLASGKAYDDNGFLHFNFNGHRVANKYKDVFYCASEKYNSFAVSDDNFVGTYGNLSNPLYIHNDKLNNEFSVFEEGYCGAFQFNIELKPNEEKEIYLVVGTATCETEIQELIDKYNNKKEFENQLQLLKIQSEEYIKCSKINTPDKYLNSMVNIWLKRQISLGKTWGRIYGKGYRDLLQDITGFVSFDKKAGRKRLLYTMEHEFISGNALRQFDPVVDYPYQDMPVWVPIAILSYIKESGDLNILNEKIGYYDSDIKDSVFTHLKRGMDYLYNSKGKHGLNLWGGGDWNDSMNTAGLQMIGESVWLSIATIKASKDYLEILELYNKKDNLEIIKQVKNNILNLEISIEKYGFENDHYIYGINDWGEKVGSDDNTYGKIYLNPQTWSVIAGVGDKERQKQVMQTVENRLKCAYGYMQNLPAYKENDDHIGRISYFGQGLYENGSVYLHGVMFKVIADCLLNNSDSALKTLEMIRYSNKDNEKSGVEPYVMSNMYFGVESIARKGFAPCSWVTGSAGWMYRAITEFILGVKPEFYGLKIEPVLPSNWNYITFERKFRDVNYNITIKKGTESYILVDNNRIDNNIVPIYEEGTTHSIMCFVK